MKIVQINATCGAGSTGKICVAVSELLTEKGIENYILYSMGKSDYPLGIKYQNDKYTRFQALYSRIFGNYGFNSYLSTRKMLKELRKINPDIVHLHNLHAHNCNLKILLEFLKRRGIKVFWTFHDCWTMTGYCPHFLMAGCDKWKTGCESCVQRKEYSWFFDKSKKLYNLKRKLFEGLDLTIVTPSEWLAGVVKESFLKGFPVKVINNGIDLSIFKPTESDFRKKYDLEDKYIVLGVAFGWGVRKGLDVFIELSKHLDDNYKIVLVGTNDDVDRQLPQNIISIHRTENQQQLAQIYTAADVLFNPTREENYPTVHMESIACGTPVVTFDVGGCKEMLSETTGISIKKDSVEEALSGIIKICDKTFFSGYEFSENNKKDFSQNSAYQKYIELYEEVN